MTQAQSENRCSSETKFESGFKHIICPQELEVSSPSVFFAGGISNCPDWQSDLADLLAEENVTAFNPRRPDFPMNDPSASDAQIKWEHRYLKHATAVSFWFPKETVCPITLYELGTYTYKDTPVFVGVHPDYERDVELLALMRVHSPHLKVVRSLDELSDQIKSWLAEPTSIENPAPTLPAIPNDRFFIAGGIKGCPDWQSELSEKISQIGQNVYNPRKADFTIASDSSYGSEVYRNHQVLMDSEAISFWFPKESINPVVLYELGIASMTSKKLFVGVDPEYFRSTDVEIQTSLVRPDVKIAYSLDSLAQQISDWKASQD